MNSIEPELFQLDLKTPLLIVRGSRGLLASDHLNITAFNQSGEAVAVVAGAGSFDEMMTAKVVAVSYEGMRLGLAINMTGAQVIEKICDTTASKHSCPLSALAHH